jgi:hypothetical protein
MSLRNAGKIALYVGALLLPTTLSEHFLREPPFYSNVSMLGDLISSENAQASQGNKNDFETMVRNFNQIDSVLFRGRWIPAGGVFPKTNKEGLYNCDSEAGWNFIDAKLLDEKNIDSKEFGLYSKGEYSIILRNSFLDRTKSHLHVTAFTSSPFVWDEIDLIGTYNSK